MILNKLKQSIEKYSYELNQPSLLCLLKAAGECEYLHCKSNSSYSSFVASTISVKSSFSFSLANGPDWDL